MEALTLLTALSIILLIGVLLTIFSRYIKVPNILFLVIAGYLITLLPEDFSAMFKFPTDFFLVIALIALVMVVFDSTSKLRIKTFGDVSMRAMKLSFIFLIINMVILGFLAKVVFSLPLYLALIFASLMVGTDPTSSLQILKDIKHKVVTFLKIESIINTPITVIVPFIIVDFIKSFERPFIGHFLSQLAPFIKLFVTGVGTGLLVGLITFKFMSKEYSKILSPLALLSASLLTYVIAESLQGSGVIAVTTFGLVFGRVYIKEKYELRTFGEVFSNIFEILIYVMLGFFLKLSYSLLFYLKTLLLFAVFIVIRYFSIELSLTREKLNFKEKLFLTLNLSKGVAVAVVLFTLVSYKFNLDIVFDLSLMFVFYSIIVSSIVTRFNKFFLRGEKQ